MPVREPGDQVVQSWDTAVTAKEHSDYSVCTTWLYRWRTQQAFLLDVSRAKLEYPALKAQVVAQKESHRAGAVLIEFSGLGQALVQELPQLALHPILVRPTEDKLTRMMVQSAKIEAGQVFIPDRAPWLADFRAEVLAFPNGSHDDQIDSVSQFLNWINVQHLPSVVVGRYGTSRSI